MSALADARQRHDDLSSSYLVAQSAMRSSVREEAQDYLGKLFAPHSLRLHGERSRLDFRHSSVRLDQSTLHFVDYGSSHEGVTIVVPRMAEDLFLEFPLCGEAHVTAGASTSVFKAGGVIVAPRGDSYVSHISSNYRQLALQVPLHLLARVASLDLAELRSNPLTFDVGCLAATGAVRVLNRLVREVCLDIEADDQPLSSVRVRRSLEEAIVSLVLDLRHNYSDRLRDGAVGVSPYYVKRAEDFIRTNLTEEIDLDDIVRASGVSKRSLHAGFRRFLGTTPIAFLKRLRLEAARNELQSARLNSKSVTEVATEYGFFHLSKFARDFKQQFGLLPSELRRQ